MITINRIKKILYLLILIGQTSCLNMVDPEEQIKYIEALNSFDKNLIDHFPKKIPNNAKSYSIASPKLINYDYNYINTYLTIQIPSKNKYKTRKVKLLNESKLTIKSTDKCLLKINYDFDKKSEKNIPKCKNLIPIPYNILSNYNYKKETYENQDNIKIAVLNYKSGKVIENLREKSDLPEKWKNGYSKGYAFNDKNQTITYWLLIW